MKGFSSLAVAFAAAVVSTSAYGAVVTTSAELGTGPADAFPGSPVFQTTSTPNASQSTSNGGGSNVAITFTTGSTGYTLDRFAIVAGGGAGANVQIYRIPQFDAEGGNQGGKETDGYVNVTTTPGLLNGGTPLAFNFNGSPTQSLLTFDLTGTDEIALLPNSVYAIDFTSTANFFVRRGGAFFTGGSNIYAGTGNDRFDVAGGRRDAPLALYAVAPIPEPTALAALGLAGAFLGRRRRS